MTLKFKTLINFEYLKNIILILLITFFLYVILVQYNDDKAESFSDNLFIFDDISFEYSAGVIYKRIRKLINKKIKKSSIEEVTSSRIVENEFTMNEYNIPIGVIRFFPYELPVRYNSWVLCDGTSKRGEEYPELFRLINDRDPNSNDQFEVPNLVGRTIFGRRFNRSTISSPDVNPLAGSGGKFMNPSNSNFFTELDTSEMSEGIPLTQLQDLGVDSAMYKLSQGSIVGIKYSNLGTDGIDGCPEDDRQDTIARELSGDINVCVDNNNTPSNIPPYIALYPYIKSKPVRYKYNIE